MARVRFLGPRRAARPGAPGGRPRCPCSRRADPDCAAAPVNWTRGSLASAPANQDAPSELGPAERTLARSGSELERALGRG